MVKKTSAYINDPAKYCHVPKLICLLDYHGQHSQSDALKPYPSEIHLSTWQRIRLFYRLNSFKSIVWGFLLLLFLLCLFVCLLFFFPGSPATSTGFTYSPTYIVTRTSFCTSLETTVNVLNQQKLFTFTFNHKHS